VANELGHFGITINTIGTGGFATERYTSYMRRTIEAQGKNFDEREAKRHNEIPVGRLGEPEEVARVVEFLVDRDAGYITGTVVSVNGGLNM
jgi:NAD(P)-dependent dehydrogenase (short-subunit alcohol dehydrogenase family)